MFDSAPKIYKSSLNVFSVREFGNKKARAFFIALTLIYFHYEDFVQSTFILKLIPSALTFLRTIPRFLCQR